MSDDDFEDNNLRRVNPRLTEQTLSRKKLDTSCSTFIEIERYIKARVDICRKANDKPCDDEKTDHIRGRIRELNDLLKAFRPKDITFEQNK